MQNENGNGSSNGEIVNGTDKVTIQLNRATNKIHIDLHAENLEVALSLIERARRELDARYRMNRSAQLLEEMREQQATAELAASVRRDMRA